MVPMNVMEVIPSSNPSSTAAEDKKMQIEQEVLVPIQVVTRAQAQKAELEKKPNDETCPESSSGIIRRNSWKARRMRRQNRIQHEKDEAKRLEKEY